MNGDRIERGAIAAQLRTAGVPHAAILAGLASSALRITPTRTSQETLKLGQSRFGGDPDVPATFDWPIRSGTPLAFLAQLDLSEFDSPDLPATGWLVFFYDYVTQPWGFEPADAGAARVIHLDVPRSALVRTEAPRIDETGEPPFAPCALTFSQTVDLPDLWDSLAADASRGLGDAKREAYAEVRIGLSHAAEEMPYHHLLGHPRLVQNDMRIECELVRHGISCGDSSAYTGALAKKLAASAPDEWRLLLQLDVDDEGPDWMWGDSGSIYFWIRRDDLAARAFERAWLILQCG